ncbi:hypothetical protein RA19_23740 [Leisingera sp. ANG-M1]|nr:hypothetical protein RA19_23740 [Leisingera sp. ANG-M1]
MGGLSPQPFSRLLATECCFRGNQVGLFFAFRYGVNAILNLADGFNVRSTCGCDFCDFSVRQFFHRKCSDGSSGTIPLFMECYDRVRKKLLTLSSARHWL